MVEDPGLGPGDRRPGEGKPDAHVRDSRTPGTPPPRRVGDAREVLEGLDPRQSGSVWQLTPPERDLDANVIALPAGGSIEAHAGPELDVLIHVLEGSGTLGTGTGMEPDKIDLEVGSLVWLPKRSWRRFDAGPQGLRYFSVHHRKPGLSIRTHG